MSTIASPRIPLLTPPPPRGRRNRMDETSKSAKTASMSPFIFQRRTPSQLGRSVSPASHVRSPIQRQRTVVTGRSSSSNHLSVFASPARKRTVRSKKSTLAAARRDQPGEVDFQSILDSAFDHSFPSQSFQGADEEETAGSISRALLAASPSPSTSCSSGAQSPISASPATDAAVLAAVEKGPKSRRRPPTLRRSATAHAIRSPCARVAGTSSQVTPVKRAAAAAASAPAANNVRQAAVRASHKVYDPLHAMRRGASFVVIDHFDFADQKPAGDGNAALLNKHVRRLRKQVKCEIRHLELLPEQAGICWFEKGKSVKDTSLLFKHVTSVKRGITSDPFAESPKSSAPTVTPRCARYAITVRHSSWTEVGSSMGIPEFKRLEMSVTLIASSMVQMETWYSGIEQFVRIARQSESMVSSIGSLHAVTLRKFRAADMLLAGAAASSHASRQGRSPTQEPEDVTPAVLPPMEDGDAPLCTVVGAEAMYDEMMRPAQEAAYASRRSRFQRSASSLFKASLGKLRIPNKLRLRRRGGPAASRTLPIPERVHDEPLLVQRAQSASAIDATRATHAPALAWKPKHDALLVEVHQSLDLSLQVARKLNTLLATERAVDGLALPSELRRTARSDKFRLDNMIRGVAKIGEVFDEISWRLPTAVHAGIDVVGGKSIEGGAERAAVAPPTSAELRTLLKCEASAWRTEMEIEALLAKYSVRR